MTFRKCRYNRGFRLCLAPAVTSIGSMSGYGHGDGAWGTMDEWDQVGDEISEPDSIEECSDEEAFGGGPPLYLHEECSDEEASGGDEPSLMHA